MPLFCSGVVCNFVYITCFSAIIDSIPTNQGIAVSSAVFD